MSRCSAPAPFAGEATESRLPEAPFEDKSLSASTTLALLKTLDRRLLVLEPSFEGVLEPGPSFSAELPALADTRLSQQPVHGNHA